MAFLFLVLAFSMAIATFVESNYGTPTAQALIYKTRWFELIWILLGINLVKNMFRYRFFTNRRFTLGLFHLSFIVILIGAAITRYISYEGMMHIRENQSSNYIVSTDSYFYAAFGDQEKEKKVLFSELAPKQFSGKFNVDGVKVKVRSIGYIENAESKPMPSESGEPIIDFVYSSPSAQGMQSYPLKYGDVMNAPGLIVGFNSSKNIPVRFFLQDGRLMLVADSDLEEMTMSTQESVSYPAGDTIPAKTMHLYSYGGYRFLLRNYLPNATFTAVKSQMQTNQNAVLIQISDGINQQVVHVFGRSGVLADTVRVPLGSGQLKLAFGSMPIYVPFSIYLKDFQLDRYPGSDSPSSFASEVTLIDQANGLQKDIRIFMNNTLTYQGYKFFQSSYDTDERGTVLSVNHDFWGTNITYLGYFLMMLGFVLALVNKNSYFQYLVKKLKQVPLKTAVLIFAIGLISLNSKAQSGFAGSIPDIPANIVTEFSKIYVQGVDGRIEPASTLNSEVVRKLTHRSTMFGLSPDEMVLSMMAHPEIWHSIPIILVPDETLQQMLGVSDKFMSFHQIFDEQGRYRILESVRSAYAKAPAMRSKLEKEYLNLDERINVTYMVFEASLYNMFPRARVEDHWYHPGETAVEYSGGDSIFVKSGFQLMLQNITEQNYVDAAQILAAISNFQVKYGGNLIPSDKKRNIEITYNRINPFKRIFPYYLLFGFLLLVVLLINIFRQKQLPQFIRITFFSIIILLFAVHTVGLAVRWYISGHAPWSNGYESVVYVAWAVMLAGVIFGRKYMLVSGTAAFLSGIALFVAHLSWMNPEITPLVPVLKSYWLAIHVAIITGSYGFLGLSSFLGVLVMILMVLRRKHNEIKVTGFIEQITTVNEMSATVGLYMLTTGTFLGGVWANESWGRYWGWDPKETWALITVVIYSFIVHMRLIPALKGVFNYNMASIFGFASVLMTYFGVNYFLSGLHSYGKGVADGINPMVPISFGIFGVLMIWAYIKQSKFEKENAV